MALRLADDFAGYFNLDDLISGMWTSRSTAGVTLDPAGSGRGGPCVAFDQLNSYIERTFNTQVEWTVGFRFIIDTLPSLSDWVLELKESSASKHTQVGIQIRSDGAIALTNNYFSTLYVSTTANSAYKIVAGQEYHFEFKAVINNSTGTAEVRINNVPWIVFTGDTHYTGETGATNIRIGHYPNSTSTAAAPRLRIWDFYALDGQAGASGFQGQSARVDTLTVSGAGSSAQFTVTGAATNHEAVDDAAHNFDTDFVDSSTVGQKDLHALSNLPISTTGAVIGLIVVNTARSDDGQPRGLNGKVKSGATEGTSGNFALTSTFAKYPYVLETNPATAAAFTKAEINSLEAGYEVAN